MKNRPYELTDDEANAIKDILRKVNEPMYRRVIGQVAMDMGIKTSALDKILDKAFIKLGNGRVTAIVDGVRTPVEKELDRLPTIEELKNTAMDGSRLT